MTRYCIFLLSLFALSSLKVFADNQTIGITLNAENNYRDSSYLREMGEIIIVASPNNNNDKARVSIQVKNTTGDGRGLLLFNSDYTEKETKKLKKDKIISYDIEWSDLRKSSGKVKPTSDLQEDAFFIPQGDVKTLPLQIPDMGNEEKELRLSFYPCEVKKKNKEGQITKVRISPEETYLIKISVELGPDIEFEELKSSCEALVSKIEKATFCPIETHKHGSIQSQVDALEAEYKAKIYEINQCANNHSGIYGHEIDDSKYGQLKRDIEQAFSAKMECLRSKSPSCIAHCPPPPVKKCDFCGLPKGKGKNRCHGSGSCDTHHKPIGCSKGCPKNHPKQPPFTWGKAAKELEAISRKLNREKISCADAKKQAKSIINKASKEATDVKNKPSAMRKYGIIMDCK